MTNKFKKNSAKKKNFIKIAIISVCVIILLIGILFLCIGIKNIIEISNVNDDSKFVSDDVAQNSTPILINNLVLGAVYENQWVASEKFYFYGNTEKGTKVDVYTASGKKGTYELESIRKDSSSSAIYMFTSNSNKNDEYIAVPSSDENVMPIPANKKEDITEQDYKYVKKALGIYRLLNYSVDIKEAYEINISNTNSGVIYVVNSRTGKSLGGYSAVIYKDFTGKVKILKYSFVANLEDASEWPIYSFKFIADLNQDGKNEIIIQETEEFEVKYDVIEYNNGKFVEVLSSEMSI